MTNKYDIVQLHFIIDSQTPTRNDNAVEIVCDNIYATWCLRNAWILLEKSQYALECLDAWMQVRNPFDKKMFIYENSQWIGIKTLNICN